MDDEKVNILVVDDLDEKLLVYEMILAGLGQNLVKARSGREALRHLLDKEFAVILLDVQMPEMDGLETAAMIRSRRQTAQTPIIFVTAFSDEMHTAQGYSLGAVDYILTPVVPEILRTKVGVFVELYKKTQQVKRQAQEHVALARAQAARAAAEEATRRSSFLAEASTVLSRSLDFEAIPEALAGQAVPFLGDLCAVVMAEEGEPARWRMELAWVEPTDGMTVGRSSRGSAPDLGPLWEPIRRVAEGGEWEIWWPGTPAGDPAGERRDESTATARPERTEPADRAARSRAPASRRTRSSSCRFVPATLPRGPSPWPSRAAAVPTGPRKSAWPATSPAAPPSPSTTPGSTATSRRTTAARTSSWPCWPTSSATRWPPSATPSRSSGCSTSPTPTCTGPTTSSPGRSSNSSDWSTTSSTSRGSPAARSSSARSRWTSPSPWPGPSRPAGR